MSEGVFKVMLPSDISLKFNEAMGIGMDAGNILYDITDANSIRVMGLRESLRRISERSDDAIVKSVCDMAVASINDALAKIGALEATIAAAQPVVE